MSDDRIPKALPAIIDRHDLIEETLEVFRTALAGDLAAYRGHVYRVFNFTRALAGTGRDHDDKIACAAVFHDLGIWSDHTVDYLPPSSRRLREYLQRSGRETWSSELSRMIDMHHKLTRYRGEHVALVEPFRRADLIDLSLSLIRFSLPRAYVKEIQSAFPHRGFQARVVQLVGGWAITHPMRPLPMVRW